MRLRPRLRHGLAALVLASACSGAGDGRSPGDELGDAAFWSLVAQAKTTGGTDVADRAAVLTQLLSHADRQRLEAFQQHLAQAATALDTRGVHDAAVLVCGRVDPSGFTGFRSWVVAQGRQTQQQVVADPDALAGLPDLPAACDGSGAAFGDAALPRYSDLGFEPGSEAFPSLDTEAAPRGQAVPLPRLRARFGP